MSSAHHIKHTSIRNGDLIRVSGKFEDVDLATVGKVAHRYQNGRSTVYETAKNVELVQAHPDGTMTRGGTVVTRLTLLNRDPSLPEPLFNL